MEIAEALNRIEKDGDFYPKSSDKSTITILKTLASSIDAKKALEIGTHLGYSGLTLLASMSEKAKLVTVDKMPLFLKYLRNLKREDRKRITFIRGTSYDIHKKLKSNEKFDIVFLDAGHTFYWTLTDLINTLPYVRPGGFLVIHDALNKNAPGVFKGIGVLKRINTLMLGAYLEIVHLPTPISKDGESAGLCIIKVKGAQGLLSKIALSILSIFHKISYLEHKFFVEAILRTPIKNGLFNLFVLLSRPVQLKAYDKKIGICSLVGGGQIFMFVACIKSFLRVLKMSLPVVVVDDGTLTDFDVLMLEKYLINIKVIRRAEADQKIKGVISRYPFCMKYRNEKSPTLYRHNLKLFDPVLLSGFNKYILLDSDIIFFRRPKAILDWIRSNKRYNLHMSYAPKEKDVQLIETLQNRLIGKLFETELSSIFNSGIIGAFRKDLDMSFIEDQIRNLYKWKLEHAWFGEQMIFSTLFSNAKRGVYVKALDPYDYHVKSTDYFKNRIADCICIHFDGQTKYSLPNYAITTIFS
jgi:16S rRNA G966 N2-methylase RsmD